MAAKENEGEFSHICYDTYTEALFIYFNKATVQDFSSPKVFDPPVIEEVCIHLKKDQYDKLRQYLLLHPTKETLLL